LGQASSAERQPLRERVSAARDKESARAAGDSPPWAPPRASARAAGERCDAGRGCTPATGLGGASGGAATPPDAFEEDSDSVDTDDPGEREDMDIRRADARSNAARSCEWLWRRRGRYIILLVTSSRNKGSLYFVWLVLNPSLLFQMQRDERATIYKRRLGVDKEKLLR
jgi:hypothetical protein